MKQLRKDKKGVIGIIFFFIILFVILIVGFIAAILWGIIDFASDEITPIMTSMGMVGDTNVSEVSEYSFGVVDKTIQALSWVIALGYVMALIFTIVFVFVASYTQNKAFIGFYFVLMILLIFGCIVMSNMYQDIYSGNDEISMRLQEQTILSYMLLHSPFIMVLISIIGGVLMFTLPSREEGGYV